MTNILAEEYYYSVVGKPEPRFTVLKDKYTDSKFKCEEMEYFFLSPLQRRKSRVKRLVKYLIHEEKFKPKFMLTFTFNDNCLVPIEEVGSEVGNFWNRINSLSKKGYINFGKRIGAVEKGEKNNRVHWHDLTDIELPETENILSQWEGRIWFQNMYTRLEVKNVMNKHFRPSRKVKDLFSKNIMNRSKTLQAVNGYKCFNSFFTLINNSCKTRSDILAKIKPFIKHLQRCYGKNIKYMIRIFRSRKYKCYSAYVLTDVQIREVYLMCQSWKKGYLSIEYLQDPEASINYAFGYVFKNFPGRLTYGSGYSWSRGLEHPPKKWMYVEEVGRNLTEEQAILVIEEGCKGLKKLQYEREQKMILQREQNRKYLLRLKKKKKDRIMKKIRWLNKLFGKNTFNLSNYNPNLKDPTVILKKKKEKKRKPVSHLRYVSKYELLAFIADSRIKNTKGLCSRQMIDDYYFQANSSSINLSLDELKTYGYIMEFEKELYLFLKYG